MRIAWTMLSLSSGAHVGIPGERCAGPGHRHRRSKDSLLADYWREDEHWYPTANLSD
jgi:hypothetical protein